MEGIGKRFSQNKQHNNIHSKTIGNAIIFAGSCSNATQKQVHNYLDGGGNGIELDPEKLLQGTQNIQDVWNQICKCNSEDILIYSCGSAGKIQNTDNHFAKAQILEDTVAALAKKAAENGYNRIISAGGETSGAITKSLGFDSYYIGESVAPGVPIMIPFEKMTMRLVLKSGNFGSEDFFTKALEKTGSGKI